MDSTKYILFFVLTMTTIVALVLTTLTVSWKAKSEENEAIFNKRNILSAIQSQLDQEVKIMGDQEILDLFDQKVEQFVVDMNGDMVDSDGVIASGYKKGRAEDIDLKKEEKKPEAERIMPLYVYSGSQGKNYIMAVRGNGLWDKIWGSIAVSDDFNTLVGATFDHQAETPGLGAEIKDNPAFAAAFQGTKIYNDKGDYVSVKVRKGGAKNKTHEVDGISGATITSDGVSEMLFRCIKYYEPYFSKIKNTGNRIGLHEQGC